MIYIFVKIYRNFLDSSVHKNIYSQMTSSGFAWYNFRSVVTANMKQADKFFVPQVFRHCIVQDYRIESQWIRLLEPILYKIKEVLASDIELINMHANWMWPNQSSPDQIDYPHIDGDQFDDNCLTCIYYFTDSTSETILYNQSVNTNSQIDIEQLTVKEKVLPEKNKLVMWPAKQIHSAPAFTAEPRMVLNINIRKK